jgi:O-methyltransferase
MHTTTLTLEEPLSSSLAQVIDARIQESFRYCALDNAIDVVVGSQVEGDYLEFGVATGRSFTRAYHELQRRRSYHDVSTPIRYFAFDSYEGLPPSDESLKPKQYRHGAYAVAEEAFRANLTVAGVPLDEVVMVKRWYQDLTAQDKLELGLTKAALVHIDCDLYVSARDVLRFVGDLLVDGSVVVLDDYFRHRISERTGIRRAWLEFLEEHPHLDATLIHMFRRVAFGINLR